MIFSTIFIENSFALLFDTSFETSLFPDSWEISRMTPIYKDGDKTDKSNERLVSILSFTARLFGKTHNCRVLHVYGRQRSVFKYRAVISYGQYPRFL